MKLFFGLFVVSLPLFLGGCTPSGQSHGTFVFCSEGSPTKLNPQVLTDGTSITASAYTIFDRLVEFELGGTAIVPGLAHRWSISDDGKEYTFFLRKKVPFHSNELFTPTRPFNADDVVDSFERMRNPKHPLHQVSGGSYEFYHAFGMDKNVKDVIKEGDHQIKVVLNKAQAPFLSYMASPHMSIVSKEYRQKLESLDKKELFDTKPIGTGPFVFQKYTQDILIRYKAFKGHFSKAPRVDRLIFSITPDPSVRFQKLKTGECHLVFAPGRSDIALMDKHKDIKLSKGTSMNVGYLAMNVEKPPFDNPKVRLAVNKALNKKSYLDAIYLGHATMAKNPLPPDVWGYNDDIKGHTYDPQKAKELLKQAGLADGFSTELWTLPISRPYNPNGKKMGELMQADLAKVGIKVKLVSFDWGTFLEKSRKGQHQMIQLGWSADYPDPDNFLRVLLSCASAKIGTNTARFCHKDFDNLVTKALAISSPKQRTKLYRMAQKIFHKEVPWVPLAHSTLYRAMRKSVQGYVMDPLGRDYFHTVSVE